ncbi:hypothetical protein [Tuwongella immobilis]|uniref:Uncharacterized protein n=1 Tax=Tuwongella immobilis TaxID=692036 RepID=A0A6C2YQL1_9BACT|nr:hypothetical protein [Tuwongella immobilis]VIP03930.1 Uncharacterized protein OS=Singulisphaera acidiphila (strain ATCC BAA-1392 / DSM 18658 / VKM B-2454 / MOB10) GN=Sinac_6708 PE=4 SV=1 [Tuwongella immobilis]VTS05227.1 Uncharacterized protein OS=Singulisphaera acidiphila (strain ATCC BAA-1392 / DSM 18658 / VKM B-2454 / MOB10) GN=Sinac_6708 PE=4 SV=1 [Tuwongella immobilis]
MPMPPYPVRCYAVGCGELASFKIAARWSDGVTAELKTYALSCPRCVSQLFQAAQERRAQCRLAPGETLEPTRVFTMVGEGCDRDLKCVATAESNPEQPESV